MALSDRIEHLVIIPDGVEAKLSEDGDVTISGENGSQTRNFSHSKLQLLEQGNGLLVRVDLPRRKEKAMAGTWKAHLNNMVKGVTEGFTYRLKAVYSHFPMNLKVESTELVVNNYFGETVKVTYPCAPGNRNPVTGSSWVSPGLAWRGGWSATPTSEASSP
ncbi:MAG TPA: 50S ribosomal protein L6 [Candidatus Poseidoniales archaeon]|nr:50S ribosomal protein L6 [Candidatus Poseidoniales archaeon]